MEHSPSPKVIVGVVVGAVACGGIAYSAMRRREAGAADGTVTADGGIDRELFATPNKSNKTVAPQADVTATVAAPVLGADGHVLDENVEALKQLAEAEKEAVGPMHAEVADGCESTQNALRQMEVFAAALKPRPPPSECDQGERFLSETQCCADVTVEALNRTHLLNEKEVIMVMQHTHCSREAVIEVIEKHNGDLVEAILELGETPETIVVEDVHSRCWSLSRARQLSPQLKKQDNTTTKKVESTQKSATPKNTTPKQQKTTPKSAQRSR